MEACPVERTLKARAVDARGRVVGGAAQGAVPDYQVAPASPRYSAKSSYPMSLAIARGVSPPT